MIGVGDGMRLRLRGDDESEARFFLSPIIFSLLGFCWKKQRGNSSNHTTVSRQFLAKAVSDPATLLPTIATRDNFHLWQCLAEAVIHELNGQTVRMSYYHTA